jgi:large subunit ribosomal protein L9
LKQGDLAVEIILLEKVNRLGNMGDTVTVKNGFARNYLIPQGKALRASKANIEFFESKKAEIKAQNDSRRKEAEKIAKKLEGTKIDLVRAAADDGKLYGSVTVRDIGDALEAMGFAIPRQNLLIDTTIKTIGQFEVRVMPHPEIELKLPVRVMRNESEFTRMDEEAAKEAAKAQGVAEEETPAAESEENAA